MEYKFFTHTEYRVFIRKLPLGIRFETKSKPFEIPIILIVNIEKDMYLI